MPQGGKEKENPTYGTYVSLIFYAYRIKICYVADCKYLSELWHAFGELIDKPRLHMGIYLFFVFLFSPVPVSPFLLGTLASQYYSSF